MNDLEPLESEPLTLTNAEFAAIAGISESRFYQLRAADLIPETLRSPIPNRWSRPKVVAWLAEGAPALMRARGRRKVTAA